MPCFSSALLSFSMMRSERGSSEFSRRITVRRNAAGAPRLSASRACRRGDPGLSRQSATSDPKASDRQDYAEIGDMAGDIVAASFPSRPNGRLHVFGGIGIIMLLLIGMPIMIGPPPAAPMIGSTSTSTSTSSIIVGGVGSKWVDLVDRRRPWPAEPACRSGYVPGPGAGYRTLGGDCLQDPQRAGFAR